MAHDKHTVLYFTGLLESISLLIPKQRGSGYLKSPFGGHHSNERYWRFLEAIGQLTQVDDIDGYVNVSTRYLGQFDDKEEFEKKVMEAVIKVFPQVEKYEEIQHAEFWKIVEGK